MAQFKIYGYRSFLEDQASAISDAIHEASEGALGLPPEKRFHRFMPLEDWQFIAPGDRTRKYLIIELLMFEGRPVATKKLFYNAVLTNLTAACDMAVNDIELTIVESPRHNWLIRGQPADELVLNYNVDHHAD